LQTNTLSVPISNWWYIAGKGNPSRKLAITFQKKSISITLSQLAILKFGCAGMVNASPTMPCGGFARKQTGREQTTPVL
jgi:hypothetical protein